MNDTQSICLAAVLCVMLATVGWIALLALLWRIINVVRQAVDRFKLKKVNVTGRKVLIEGEDERNPSA